MIIIPEWILIGFLINRPDMYIRSSNVFNCEKFGHAKDECKRNHIILSWDQHYIIPGGTDIHGTGIHENSYVAVFEIWPIRPVRNPWKSISGNVSVHLPAIPVLKSGHPNHLPGNHVGWI